MNLTNRVILNPKRLKENSSVALALRNYLINLSFECSISERDVEIANYIKDKSKESVYFEVPFSNFDYLTKAGLALSDNLVFKETFTDKFELVKFAEQDRFDEDSVVRKEYRFKTESYKRFLTWFESVQALSDNGKILYSPEVLIDRNFERGLSIEENTKQINNFYGTVPNEFFTEPLLELDINHFNEVDLKTITKIVTKNPEITAHFGRKLTSLRNEITDSVNNRQRQSLIADFKYYFKDELDKIEKKNKQIKRDLFYNSSVNILSTSTLILSGFFFEGNVINFLLPGGLVPKQIDDFRKFIQLKRELKENELYFLFMINPNN